MGKDRGPGQGSEAGVRRKLGFKYSGSLQVLESIAEKLDWLLIQD